MESSRSNNIPKSVAGRLRCTILDRDTHDSKALGDSRSFRYGLVIDDGCSKDWLSKVVHPTRTSLTLNHKRPTVDRRFYCDHTRSVICKPLEEILSHALDVASPVCGKRGSSWKVFCNKYLRFLEYNTVGSELLPHRDGFKTCEDTGTRSTHTLLLFLSNCERGGETLLMDDSPEYSHDATHWTKEKNLVLSVYDEDTQSSERLYPKPRNQRRLLYEEPTTSRVKVLRLRNAAISSEGLETEMLPQTNLPPPSHISLGVQPIEGRMLVFPHHWPHAGAMCQSLPKIALRAELTIVGSDA